MHGEHIIIGSVTHSMHIKLIFRYDFIDFAICARDQRFYDTPLGYIKLLYLFVYLFAVAVVFF